jgi:hypothetical protein
MVPQIFQNKNPNFIREGYQMLISVIIHYSVTEVKLGRRDKRTSHGKRASRFIDFSTNRSVNCCVTQESFMINGKFFKLKY